MKKSSPFSDELVGGSGNIVIGYAYGYAKGYCRRCKKLFDIGFNAVRPFSRSDTCPTCEKWDKVETDDFIADHISVLEMFETIDDIDEAHKKKLVKRIAKLKEIQKLFKEDKLHEEQKPKEVRKRNK